jgi:hypothetical protein
MHSQGIEGAAFVPKTNRQRSRKDLPKIVKRFTDSNNNNIVLTQKIYDSTNANYREGYSAEFFGLYKEKEIAEGLSTYQLLERKEVHRDPAGISILKKEIFDKSGDKIATFESYERGKKLYAYTEYMDVVIRKLGRNQLQLDTLQLKDKGIAGWSGMDVSKLRPEVKRLLKLITGVIK